MSLSAEYVAEMEAEAAAAEAAEAASLDRAAEEDRALNSRENRTASKNDNWGSSIWMIEAARTLMGRIDYDPASSAYWNTHNVCAATFSDAEEDGLSDVAWEKWWAAETIVNNAPGERTGKRIQRFWDRLVYWYAQKIEARDVLRLQRTMEGDYVPGEVEELFQPSYPIVATWVGFNLEQLRSLQKYELHPLNSHGKMRTITLILAARPSYFTETDAAPVLQESPTHAGYITFLPHEMVTDLEPVVDQILELCPAGTVLW